MNTPLSWIKAYVPDLDVTNQEYADAMTLSGTNVEGFKAFDEDLDKIVVGQIEKIEKHPDADKLVVCQINVGEEVVQIVTGATNVEEGQKIPVVLDGGRVAGGHDGSKKEGGIKIKKGKLRGVESQGMLCSIEELGQTNEMYPDAPEDGIYILDAAAVVGDDAIAYLGLRDSVFEYEVTSNRVDCYSVLGIAREAAATFNIAFNPPLVDVKENDENVNNFIAVEVEDKELCPRFCARVIKNVKIEPSPKWMQRRLAAVGIRPINNVVDITNYVMEEYGQPMHAYDLSTIAGKKIIVKRAKDNEFFQTLDGNLRKLDSDMLMICDGEKEIGIAGIMGGENSKITDDIKEIVFEAACFDGTNTRLASKRLGLRTDASGKFEKGLDPNNTLDALNRACQLMVELGAGEVVGGLVDVNNSNVSQKAIPFDSEKINKLLGTDISEEEMLSYFKRIELTFNSATNEVVIPTFRQDLECQADLAEEVARFYGYDNIPVTLPSGETTIGKISDKMRIEKTAREVARFCGFSQGMSYSFESPRVFDKLLIPQDSPLRDAIVISNPLGEDFSIMRTVSLNGILTSLSTNYNRRNKNVRLYELGNIYIPKQIPLTELPDERMQLTLGMYGDGDFFTMKGVVEELTDKLGLYKKLEYNPNAEKEFLHPGRQALIIYDGKVIGYLGEVHPEVSGNYDIKDRVYVAVIDMPIIYELATFYKKYEGIAKYPAINRDICVVMPKSIFVSEIEKVIEKCGGKLLEDYNLFDIYEGEQIQEDYKSVAYSIIFRAKDRTLEDGEINTIMDKIIKQLKAKDIELRA